MGGPGGGEAGEESRVIKRQGVGSWKEKERRI